MEKLAAYIRVSTQEQKLHGLSIAAQEEKLRKYAEEHDLEIVEWYRDEGVSGRKLIRKRPELQRMLLDAQSKKFSRIIFIKLDRFFRSVAEYHECMKLIEPCTWTATEEKYDLTTANGRLMVNMKLTIAELEADQTAERIKLVNEHKVSVGMPVVPTRCLPFYLMAENRQIKHRNEDAIMDLVEHVETNRSIRGAMIYVNEKYNLGLTYRTTVTALRNPLLCGQYRDNPNYCDGYISRERWDNLQKIMQRPPRATKHNDYIFQGLIKCPECGCTLNGTQHITWVNGSRYSYSVFRCPYHKRDKKCSFATLVFDSHMERLMIEQLENLIGLFDFKFATDGRKPKKEDTSKIQAELDRLTYAWTKGRIKTVEEYDKLYDDITERLRQAEEWNKTLETVPKAVKLDDDWFEMYTDLDIPHKQAFWRSLVGGIEIEWKPGRTSTKRVTSVKWL